MAEKREELGQIGRRRALKKGGKQFYGFDDSPLVVRLPDSVFMIGKYQEETDSFARPNAWCLVQPTTSAPGK